MPNNNGKIYRDTSTNPPRGIDPWSDVSYVLGRSTGDWGQLCGDVDEDGNDVNAVNVHSVHKPVRSSRVGGTEQQVKVPTKYGWQIDAKTAGSNTLSFIGMLKSQGAGYQHWRWLKPRGLNYSERYRISDFEGYNHNQLPFRTPCFFNRLTAAELNISGTNNDVEIGADQSITRTFNSNSFVLRDAYDVTVLVSIIDPDPDTGASFMNWDVDGAFDITLFDANGRVVDHDYQTGFGIATGNRPQAISLHFESFHSLEGYTGPFYIQYRFHFENHSNYTDGNNEVFVPVMVRIATSYAATLTMSRTGQDGVVIRPGGLSSEWVDNGYMARDAVFGANGHWPLAVIEVYNGSTTQRKMCLIPSSGFIPFKRIGITIQPRQQTNAQDIIVYLLYGNYNQIFPNVQQGVDYGDPSLANAYLLTCAPNCYNELGIIPREPEPMIVYQDDCQGADFYFSNGSSQIGVTPSANGFTGRDYGIRRFVLRWGIGIDNLPVPLPVTMRLSLYDTDEEPIAEQEVNFTTSGVNWDAIAEFDFSNLAGSYAPFELYARLTVEVNGELYYIRFYPQTLTTTDPGPFPLGWE